jgi:hypothetical protein
MLFSIYPVTVRDPQDDIIKSVWAAPEAFFEFFNLGYMMRHIWIPYGKWTLPNHPSNHDDYFLIRRDEIWARSYGAELGLVESDDMLFFDEMIAGLKFHIQVDVVQKSKTLTSSYHEPLEIQITVYDEYY